MAVTSRAEAAVLARLRAYGAKRLRRLTFRQNRSTIWSVTQGGTVMNLHAGYRAAPDRVLRSLAVVAKEAGTNSAAYRSAARVAREWPGITRAVERVRRSVSERRAAPMPPTRCAGTEAQRLFLRRLYTHLDRRRFGGALPEDLPLRLSDRMTSRLGQMVASGGGRRRVVEIALNVDLLLEANRAALLDTMLHEMAHAAAFLFDGDRGHGESWRAWAERAGCAPTRCADRHIVQRRRGTSVTNVPALPGRDPQLRLRL